MNEKTAILKPSVSTSPPMNRSPSPILKHKRTKSNSPSKVRFSDDIAEPTAPAVAITSDNQPQLKKSTVPLESQMQESSNHSTEDLGALKGHFFTTNSNVLLDVPKDVWEFHNANMIKKNFNNVSKNVSNKNTKGSPKPASKHKRNNYSISIADFTNNNNNNNKSSMSKKYAHERSKSLQSIIVSTIQSYNNSSNISINNTSFNTSFNPSTINDSSLSTISQVSPLHLRHNNNNNNNNNSRDISTNKNNNNNLITTTNTIQNNLYLAPTSPLNKFNISVPLQISLPPYLSPKNKNKLHPDIIFDGNGYSTFNNSITSCSSEEGDENQVENNRSNDNTSSSLSSSINDSLVSLIALLPDENHDISINYDDMVDNTLGIDQEANVNLRKQMKNIRKKNITPVPIIKKDLVAETNDVQPCSNTQSISTSNTDSLTILQSASKVIAIPDVNDEIMNSPAKTSNGNPLKFFEQFNPSPNDTKASPSNNGTDELNLNFKFPNNQTETVNDDHKDDFNDYLKIDTSSNDVAFNSRRSKLINSHKLDMASPEHQRRRSHIHRRSDSVFKIIPEDLQLETIHENDNTQPQKQLTVPITFDSKSHLTSPPQVKNEGNSLKLMVSSPLRNMESAYSNDNINSDITPTKTKSNSSNLSFAATSTPPTSSLVAPSRSPLRLNRNSLLNTSHISIPDSTNDLDTNSPEMMFNNNEVKNMENHYLSDSHSQETTNQNGVSLLTSHLNEDIHQNKEPSHTTYTQDNTNEGKYLSPNPHFQGSTIQDDNIFHTSHTQENTNTIKYSFPPSHVQEAETLGRYSFPPPTLPSSKTQNEYSFPSLNTQNNATLMNDSLLAENATGTVNQNSYTFPPKSAPEPRNCNSLMPLNTHKSDSQSLFYLPTSLTENENSNLETHHNKHIQDKSHISINSYTQDYSGFIPDISHITILSQTDQEHESLDNEDINENFDTNSNNILDEYQHDEENQIIQTNEVKQGFSLLEKTTNKYELEEMKQYDQYFEQFNDMTNYEEDLNSQDKINSQPVETTTISQFDTTKSKTDSKRVPNNQINRHRTDSLAEVDYESISNDKEDSDTFSFEIKSVQGEENITQESLMVISETNIDLSFDGEKLQFQPSKLSEKEYIDELTKGSNQATSPSLISSMLSKKVSLSQPSSSKSTTKPLTSMNSFPIPLTDPLSLAKVAPQNVDNLIDNSDFFLIKTATQRSVSNVESSMSSNSQFSKHTHNTNLTAYSSNNNHTLLAPASTNMSILQSKKPINFEDKITINSYNGNIKMDDPKETNRDNSPFNDNNSDLRRKDNKRNPQNLKRYSKQKVGTSCELLNLCDETANKARDVLNHLSVSNELQDNTYTDKISKISSNNNQPIVRRMHTQQDALKRLSMDLKAYNNNIL
ncbi:hypothetical protein TBLA_0C04920 [Henningerozyma blattae CBS 6284]|uniref:Uncharacterized protein n=1 Tax=Henningerozyma blattae (strain ATCC 34711 / CBS 6284 / DSM 70876 / NBRC 10599 / NRRL Y-10934 / UCD 77-7) TaxID=1071380 RepID=I2H1N6_HENB6|nr:hypothetical protein TBLA_0C04920 [Tetrapisispora blattae CBS 6284]CCH60288.1 hypothetical protein TBLA_0C04920 [Tetrapisispora blattae CBS 6284]